MSALHSISETMVYHKWAGSFEVQLNPPRLLNTMDGSYIGVTLSDTWYVHIETSEEYFNDLEEAMKFLWTNHSRFCLLD